MKEIIINYHNNNTTVLVLENGIITEQYQESDEKKSIESNIYLGKVEDVLPGMGVAFVNIGKEKNAFLHIKDLLPKESNVTGNKSKKIGKSDIKKYIKPEQLLMVQVKKDENETKGAKISTELNIAGKYVALIPNADFITISSKIVNQDEKDRLLNIVKSANVKQCGFIVRTAGEGKSNDEILADIRRVESIYKQIIKDAEQYTKEVPKKLYEARRYYK